MGDYKVISSDSHVIEPPDLWTTRIDGKYRDQAPMMVRMDDGADWWCCDGIKVVSMAIGGNVGVRLEDPTKVTQIRTMEDVRPGGWDPIEHVKDLDIDEVYAGIVYPSIGFMLYNNVPDSGLLTAIFKAYNDWVADFFSANANRLKGIAMLNIDDIQVGVKEMERCAKLGFSGAMIPVVPPEGRGYHLPEYEPLWAAAQDLNLPLSFHVLTNRPGPGQEQADVDSITRAFAANRDHWIKMSIGHLVYEGVFERYPKLQVGSVEFELGWIPHFIEQLDYTYTQRPQRPQWYRFKEDMLPSDYFHRNVFVGFQEDELGIRLRDMIGVDSLQWGSDYPHMESTFPRSQQILEEILVDCTEEEKAKIAGGNAARVYKV